MAAGPNYLGEIASYLAYQIPFMLLYLVGFAIAFYKRHRCPKAASLVLAAVAMMFLATFLGSAIEGYLLASSRAASVESIMPFLTAVGWAKRILHLIGLALLFAAVFVGRPPAATTDSD